MYLIAEKNSKKIMLNCLLHHNLSSYHTVHTLTATVKACSFSPAQFDNHVDMNMNCRIEYMVKLSSIFDNTLNLMNK